MYNFGEFMKIDYELLKLIFHSSEWKDENFIWIVEII